MRIPKLLFIVLLLAACRNQNATADGVAEMVKRQIKFSVELDSVQKRGIERHLIIPKKERYISDKDSSKVFHLWTVYEESPGSEKCRVIFYDEEEKKYGLGIKMNGKVYYWASYYGDFIRTLKGM